MALKAAPISVYGGTNNKKKNSPNSKLGVSDFVGCRRPSFFNFRVQRNWECLSQRAITHVEDEIPSATTQITPAGGLYRDLNSLPKPLSATDFSASSSNGKKVRVAYQGVPGAYSEAAALKAYPNCETVPCDLFEAAFKAVELWLADKAVLPIENSVGGSIHRNYDLLLRHRLHIVGEVRLVVNHCLLGLRGVRKGELKRVLSHPQTTLNELGVTRVTADDTAHAAQIVASEGVRETGAVASARAAEIYGLDVLSERIQDDSDNITRFLILAREPIIPGTDKPYKVDQRCLQFGRGTWDSIQGFSSVCSEGYFDYLFYIDFEASMAEPRAQFALGHLQEFAKFIRVLGCYPIDTIL
ncbi:arogenate dehydratase/prephenate dehydratase 1 chloroplastic [Phtheirospermum japonicum]|uniref:Arogenate dehydratase/prephenate dehydratase 1 chloroplastic n=1 Tax=Phtheirospermum japonicum TaxID=374723 RepID=A0A830B315_9LAMI|nr:arogenate dehydratase/prephenate dehydratase 1 chloroplastic [Phtheirospermum japonicum]